MAKKISFEIKTETDFGSVDDQIQNILQSGKDLTAQYKELKKAAIEATDPQEFDQLAKAAGGLKDKIDDTNRSIKNFASDTRKLDVVVGSIQGIAGGFAAVQGAVGLLGAKNEDLNKTLVKVQSSLAILNGLQQVSNTLNKNSAVGSKLYAGAQKVLNAQVFQGSIAAKAFGKALIATGIGAIVVAVGALIANFDKLKEAVLRLIPSLSVVGELFQSFTDFIGITSASERATRSLIRTNEQKIKEDERQIALNKAKGASDEELYNLERDLLIKRIENAKLLLDEKSETYEEDIENYRNLINQLQIADANFLNRQQQAQQSSRDRSLAAERVNQTRRIAILNEGLVKRLSEIELNYQREREAAIKNGENLNLVEQIYQKNRNEAIQSARTQILKLIQDIQNDIANIEGKTYNIRLKEIKDFEEDRRKTLSQEAEQIKAIDENKQKAQQESINIQKKQNQSIKEDNDKKIKDIVENINKEERELNRLNEIKKKDQEDIGKLILKQMPLIDKLREKQEELDKTSPFNIAKTGGLTGIIANLKEQIQEYETQISSLDKGYQTNLKTIDQYTQSINKNKQKIEELTKASSNLKVQIASTIDPKTKEQLEEDLAAIAKAIEDSVKLEQLKIEKLNRDIITQGLKSVIAVRTGLNQDAIDQQKELFDLEFDEFEKNEMAKIKGLLESRNISVELINELLIKYKEYYQELRNLQQAQIKENKFISDAEKETNKDRIDIETQYAEDIRDILNDEALSYEEKNKKIKKLDEELKRDLLENELDFLRKKLVVLSQDPTRNEEDIKKLNETILTIENNIIKNRLDSNETEAQESKRLQKEAMDIATEAAKNKIQIYQNFAAEVINQTDNLISSIEFFRKVESENREQTEQEREQAFERQKRAEIARTFVSTLSSAQSAYQSQFLPVPDASSPVRATIASGIAIASGLTRIAAIKRQQYRGSASAPPELNRTSILRNSGTGQIIEPQGTSGVNPSLRVFVTENDITETQRRVRVIRGGSNATF